MSQSANRDRAKRLASHYFSLAFTDNHRQWTDDHQTEVEEMVDAIIDAAKLEILAGFASAQAIWTCGCGATNGVSLDHCGRCQRNRGEGELQQP